MIKICIAGATGRMGQAIIEEDKNLPEISIISGFVGPEDKLDTLQIPLFNKQDTIKEACKDVDIWVDFTTPTAFISNLPLVAKEGVDLVVGTTGWYDKLEEVKGIVNKNKVSAVIAPNFSPVVNLQFKMAEIATKSLSKFGYDFGVVEEHHEGKLDIPSGTADKIADIVMKNTDYKVQKFRERGHNKKIPTELDMASLRLKGTVGDHELRIRGGNGRMDINTSIYTRQEFASGALYSVEWLSKNRKSGLVFEFYKDVLEF